MVNKSADDNEGMSRSWYGGSVQSLDDSEDFSGTLQYVGSSMKRGLKLRFYSKSNEQIVVKREIYQQNWRVTLRHSRYSRQMTGDKAVCWKAATPLRPYFEPTVKTSILDIVDRQGYDGLLSPTVNAITEFHKLRKSTWIGGERGTDCNIENLPDELIQHIFTFVKDTDLQSLALVSKKLRRLSMDIKFYRRQIMLNRNGPTVKHLLFTRKDERPSRERLVDCNIIRGCPGLKRRMKSGDYIHTEALSRNMEAQNKLRLFFLRKCISANVVRKQDVLEITQRKNLVPTEAYPKRHTHGGCSPLLLPQIQKLKMAFMQDRLRRALRRSCSPLKSSESVVSFY